jgi:hypothetical protein
MKDFDDIKMHGAMIKNNNIGYLLKRACEFGESQYPVV